ncbi:MAG: T9SS type A sorting domain-containing protein [Bacteroidota bacterium]
MKYRILLWALLLGPCLSAQTQKVLFIGNSYTYRNDLPKMIRDMALSTGDTIITDQQTPGGATFQGHANSQATYNKIKADNWHYVVLQGQSQEPSFPINQVMAQTFPFAARICDSIRTYNSCTRPMFYMTWGRENGDQNNCTNWPPVCSYEGMDSLLNLRYQMMGEMNNGYVSPVGAVWNYIRTNHPNIDLYDADGSHPSPTGTYAAACTFYALILQKDPSLAPYNANLSATVGEQIKLAAKAVAFDSLSVWNVGRYDPKADFVFAQSGNTVNFTHNVVNTDSFYWDFGDGSFSTDFNPVHDYPQTDSTFTVKLIAWRCGKTDTARAEINISTTSIQNIGDYSVKIYPNPSPDKIYIETPHNQSFTLTVYALDGAKLISKPSAQEISLASLPNGLYLLELEDPKSQAKAVVRIRILR